MLGCLADYPFHLPTRLNVYLHGLRKGSFAPQFVRLTDEVITEMTKTILNEDPEDYSKVGLNPFCKLNPPPDVSL